MGLHKIDSARPCQFFDTGTLEYYIKTDRDGLAITAKNEWYHRWGTEYPKKGDKDENHQNQTTESQLLLWNLSVSERRPR